jgi:hypothetical protein
MVFCQEFSWNEILFYPREFLGKETKGNEDGIGIGTHLIIRGFN